MKRITFLILPALCVLSIALVSCDVEEWRETVVDARTSKGCICTFSNSNTTYKQRFTPDDLQRRGVSSCSALQSSLMQEIGDRGSVSCRKAK